jgi:flavin-binding protein dodecin
MSSIYKVIEIIGGSEKSWEDAAKKAVEMTAKSLKEVRVAEVKELDMRVEEGKVVEYRVNLLSSAKAAPDTRENPVIISITAAEIFPPLARAKLCRKP